MSVWWFLVAVFVVSWGLTLVLRRYALAKSLMDIPNERSSHSIPTPRGGGVAIVVSFLLALPLLASLDLISLPALVGLLGSGLLVAAIGFADDHGHIAARWRLLGHSISAAWALFWLGGLPPIELAGFTVDLGWLGSALSLVYLVWMLNLYNFMDGIDGLASAEAISVCLGMCLVYWASGTLDLIWVPLILTAAVVGFLWWNFPPARIFMGDAGSGFLGLILGAIAIQAAQVSFDLLWSWVILLGVFIVDATWTLIQRFLRGDKVYEAHRSHAYQHATDQFKRHRVVTLSVVAINVLVLLPLAVLVGSGRLDGVVGGLLAYCPLMVLAWYFKAGKPTAD
ncbi:MULTISPECIES: glycosyltransferase family 4 protein [unclassified Pseudomonas]|uniref:MraY family glycosyltransferase n=1 Tax=unclassified Pseudomonas TaxID=196821 RepID=UPI002AC929B2|nr:MULTISPECIES: glycosyltransferase family 4 protein [unclassified Pseudomonas]MEB0047245.1 glycosyltransferase family 4 protein [Pseudomonas sp. Dout3]MEB0096885.1 glycosyltransferase family 4 protein [Pseudomonas sp. DC1.2]WPX57398.1 glycosyltransferase family 4 protein [Pseudomonas sp. DC1.2]